MSTALTDSVVDARLPVYGADSPYVTGELGERGSTADLPGCRDLPLDGIGWHVILRADVKRAAYGTRYPCIPASATNPRPESLQRSAARAGTCCSPVRDRSAKCMK